MVQPIESLTELARKGGTVQATCRNCGRVALFQVWALARYFRERGWDESWPGFAKRLRCAGEGGCGNRAPKVAWLTDNPPPPEPQPPRPSLVRPPAPKGVDQGEWERARHDRDRRRLIRLARG